MGRIGEVRGVEQSADGVDVKIDIGGSIITAEHFAPTGEDSRPLSGDFAATTSQPGAGRESAVAYDDATEPLAGNGEVRRYARNAAGVVVAWWWLRADGTLLLENVAGAKLELLDDGSILVNGATVTEDGDVVTPEGVSLRNHTHPTGVGPSGPPTPSP